MLFVTFLGPGRSDSPSHKHLAYMYETLAEKRAMLEADLEYAGRKRDEERKKLRVLINTVAILGDEGLVDLLISGDRQAQLIMNAAGPTLTDSNMDMIYLDGAITIAMEHGMGRLIDGINDITAEELTSSIREMISVIRLPTEIPSNSAQRTTVKQFALELTHRVRYP